MRFGDIVRCVNLTTRDPAADGLDRVVGLDHMDPGSLLLRRWDELSELPDGTSFNRTFKAGQLLFGKRRAYQRKVSVPDFSGVCSGDILVFEVSNGEMLQEFLPYVVQSDDFFEHALDTSAGSLSPRTKWQELAEYEFALPPIEEQQRITEVLSCVDRLVGHHEATMHRASDLLVAIVEDALSAFAISNVMASLNDLCPRIADGPFGSKLKTQHYCESGARVVRLQNIDRFRFNDDDKAFISLVYYEDLSASNGLAKGDLLVAGLGDEAHALGRAVVVPAHILPAVNKADCFLVRPGSRVTSEYLEVVLNSRYVSAQVAAMGRGTTRLRVSSSAYRNVKVGVPTIREQEALVERVRAVRTVADMARAAMRATSVLRKLILRRELEADVL